MLQISEIPTCDSHNSSRGESYPQIGFYQYNGKQIRLNQTLVGRKYFSKPEVLSDIFMSGYGTYT
jgi:hypothetical protein